MNNNHFPVLKEICGIYYKSDWHLMLRDYRYRVGNKSIPIDLKEKLESDISLIEEVLGLKNRKEDLESHDLTLLLPKTVNIDSLKRSRNLMEKQIEQDGAFFPSLVLTRIVIKALEKKQKEQKPFKTAISGDKFLKENYRS